MKKQKFKLSLKPFIISAIILLAISFLIGYSWKISINSRIFSVRQVIVRNSDSSFDFLKGRNIFAIDLDKESRQAVYACPDCKKIRFTRVMPNLIIVDILKRKPLALVKFYKDFGLDEDGVLFKPEFTGSETGLPVIYGLETKIFAPKAGTRYKRRELDVAIEIIKEFKASKNLRDFSLKRINVASLEEANFFMLLPRQPADFTKKIPQVEWAGFEVRTGAGNIKQKILILGGVVTQARREWQNIKYIDLRFNEPVIKLNNDVK